MRRTLLIVVAAVMAWVAGATFGTVLAACSSNDKDASAVLACGEYSSWKADVAAHLKTETETRDSLKSIWNKYAKVSEDPKVVSAFQDLLAGLTTGNLPADAISTTDDACSGY